MNKKLLITGIPGMGKTTIGDYLAENFDFIHRDVEKEGEQIIPEILSSQSTSIVATWGFEPKDSNIEIVEKFHNRGFEVLWFDGDHEAAKREFIKRDTQVSPEHLAAQLARLDLQLQRIKDSNVIERIKPRIINTFDQNHQYREKNDIIKEILNY